MNILVGGGTPGNCNCCCGYEGTPGGSKNADNNSVNNSYGYTEFYGCEGGESDGGYSEPMVRLMSTGFCRC